MRAEERGKRKQERETDEVSQLSGGDRGALELQSAAVVGLGLIGGSLARELAARGVRVLGYDRDPAALHGAVEGGVVHAVLEESLEGVKEADLLVIAVPVAAAPGVLATALPHLGSVRLVADVGSTKQAVVRAAEALGIGERFVGSHPLAGDHRSGWSASRMGLFQGARVYLSPTPSTAEPALELARQLWIGLGAEPELLDAEPHDRRLAWTSHLPQAASTALALALASAGIAPSDLGPGGRDITRLSGSSPEMWTGIALENAAALSGAIEAFEERLRELRAALTRGDEQAVHRFFEAGRQWSEGSGSPGGRIPAAVTPRR